MTMLHISKALEQTVGVYEKYRVTRTDGRDGPGQKHHGCCYFVLDLEHDEFAVDAMAAYARACRKKFPFLAVDLRKFVREWRKKEGERFPPQWMLKLKGLT